MFNNIISKYFWCFRYSAKSGVGFFEAGNFYPDFILWIKKDKQQWITFVDPKGLRNNMQNLNHPKIQFAKTIKSKAIEYENTAGGDQIILNSFILSTTKKKEIQWWADDKVFADHHVLFQNDYPDRYVQDMMGRVLGC